MFKKVLVALDFSGPAMELFNAMDDLRHLGLKELLLVHVVRVELGEEDGIHPLQKKFLEKVKSKKAELEQEGFVVNVEVPLGAAAEEIKRLAVEQQADLILIGSIGEGSAVRELMLGSTTVDVVRIAPVPVLVEKYVSAETPQRVPIFKESLATVVLPTDFSKSAEFVFKQMLGSAHLFNGVTLLNVVDRGETEAEIKNAEKEAGERLKEWEKKFVENGVKAKSIVVKGTPSSQIIAVAEKEGATLVALSRRGRGQLANLFIGSTADQVVRRSPCPVLLFGKSG